MRCHPVSVCAACTDLPFHGLKLNPRCVSQNVGPNAVRERERLYHGVVLSAISQGLALGLGPTTRKIRSIETISTTPGGRCCVYPGSGPAQGGTADRQVKHAGEPLNGHKPGVSARTSIHPSTIKFTRRRCYHSGSSSWRCHSQRWERHSPPPPPPPSSPSSAAGASAASPSSPGSSATNGTHQLRLLLPQCTKLLLLLLLPPLPPLLRRLLPRQSRSTARPASGRRRRAPRAPT